jgi:hypothetical protein
MRRPSRLHSKAASGEGSQTRCGYGGGQQLAGSMSLGKINFFRDSRIDSFRERTTVGPF